MSETLRDLVVSLSLNSDNFTRNIKSVNKHIQQAESEFKLAAAGVQGFEKSAAGLSAKLGTLGQKLDWQKTAVDQYQKALTLAKQKLVECKERQEDYAQQLVDAKGKQAELKEEVDRAREAYKRYKKTLGENDSATIAVKQNLQALKEEYEKGTEDVKKLEGQQVSLKKSTQNASDAIVQARTNLNTARAALKETEAEIDRCNKSLTTAQSIWTKAGTAIETFGNKLSKEGKAIAGAGKTLTTAVTTPIAALGAASIKASIDFESSFAGVRKTVDATEEEYAKLADASKKMSTQIATSTNEINGVMATGGQLGIYNNYLASFTRTMIDLGNSCEDLNANDAATQLAKFANIMHTDQSLFQNMGSTVVALGNNFATTERPIVEMAMRLAGAGKQVGLTEAQVLGFATALSSVGIEAQMGGSAFSKALIKMEVAAQTGGEALEDFATVSGMTEDAFKQLFETDPAAAFQSFIVGLSKMDDEGESAIVTLNDIGISEIRLRDTLLRATNATELFSRAQETATRAWAENTALTEEASKRYATTESKLKNLKNTAILFGQQVGDDLNPTIQKLTDGATDLLNKFMGMDEAQRMQIIRFAGVAAAAGPMLTAYGKVTGGIGKASTAIGKFMTSVGKAGGGFKGLMSVVKSSPSFWFAVAVAVGAGTAALIDYASGAKQAREAMEGMQKTADKWKNTAAETFYGSSQGLSFFGLSKEDFVQSGEEATATSQQWLEGLLEVWSDGKSGTNAIVNQWTDSWKALSASTREGMAELQKSADASDNTSLSAQLQADLDTLDSLDKELAALLKKRQSKLFTDSDKIRLQELIDTREALEVKYSLTPATDGAKGFDDIRQKLQAEVARAQALGKEDADASVYENATVAAAQGLAAVNDQIDVQYDKEFALIQLMEDGAEKDAAQAALDKKYNADRNAAAKEYADLLAEITPKVYGQENIQTAKTQVGQLLKMLREYSTANEGERAGLLPSLEEFTAGLKEEDLAEYLGLLTQIQSLLDSGMSEEDISQMFPEINVSEGLDQFAGIADYIELIKEKLPGLYGMFDEALPEEVLKIATDLDMTGAQARWDEFAANPGKITTDAIIRTQNLQPVVNAFIAKYTEVPEGADKSALTPEGVIAFVSAYAEAMGGADVSGLTPENVTAMVAAYQELAQGADITALKPDEITAYISRYLEQNGVNTAGLSPDGLTAFVLAYEEVAGGALTSALTPADITAWVARYLEADGVDLSQVTPDQINAIVTSFSEATNCDKSQLLKDFTAYITAYDDSGAEPPKTKVYVTGYDYLTYTELKKQTEQPLEVPVRLGEISQEEWEQKLSDGKVQFMQNGVEIPIEAVPEGTIDADTLVAKDADGTWHVMITPEITGTQEAIDEISPLVDELDQLGTTNLGKAAGILPMTTMDLIDSAIQRIEKFNRTKDNNGWQQFLGLFTGEYNSGHQALAFSMESDFNAERIAGLSAYVGEVVSAIQQVTSGKVQLTQEETEKLKGDVENLQTILTLLQGLDATDTGEHVKEGIAQGMTEAGWAADAETVAAALEAALNLALEIHSPSQRTKPIGTYTAAGVGQGMAEYDPSADAQALAATLSAALSSALNASFLRPVGLNAMAGLAAGIRAGQSSVVSAMRTAARASVNAAKAELQIHSPSRVFENEVGRMAMKGLGVGYLEESKRQAAIIRNASRYLTGEAKTGAIVSNQNDNRRTYNQNSSVNLTVQNLQVRDEQDVRSLAVEIASLTRQQQRGRGLRMA